MSVTVANGVLNPVDLIFSSPQHCGFMVLRVGGEVWCWSGRKVEGGFGL